ncbi:cell division protein ZapA [Pseudomonas aeruginosa]|uniref:cell division protein ZapA n=1 Tax=Pseudomonas aeruginosa TaxID=287 RepID=UPI0039185CF5
MKKRQTGRVGAVEAEFFNGLLADAAALLQAEVDANKRKFPYVTSNELVVLSALNLCARQLGANDGESPRLRAVEQRLEALVERIAGASG